MTDRAELPARLRAPTPVDGIAATGEYNAHVYWEQRGYVDGMRSARLAALRALTPESSQ